MDILIVEDDPRTATLMENTIAGWGHRTATAATAKEAMGKAGISAFDVVLLDIFLPDGKGHELIPQLKRVAPRAGIITMTGYNSRELELEVRKQGILFYMIKPFEGNTLKEILDHIAKKRLQERPIDRKEEEGFLQ